MGPNLGHDDQQGGGGFEQQVSLCGNPEPCVAVGCGTDAIPNIIGYDPDGGYKWHVFHVLYRYLRLVDEFVLVYTIWWTSIRPPMMTQSAAGPMDGGASRSSGRIAGCALAHDGYH